MPHLNPHVGDVVRPDSGEAIYGEIIDFGDGRYVQVRWLSADRGAFTETESRDDIVLVKAARQPRLIQRVTLEIAFEDDHTIGQPSTWPWHELIGSKPADVRLVSAGQITQEVQA